MSESSQTGRTGADHHVRWGGNREQSRGHPTLRGGKTLDGSPGDQARRPPGAATDPYRGDHPGATPLTAATRMVDASTAEASTVDASAAETSTAEVSAAGS